MLLHQWAIVTRLVEFARWSDAGSRLAPLVGAARAESTASMPQRGQSAVVPLTQSWTSDASNTAKQ